MFEIRFVDRKTGRVNYAVTGVTMIRHITASEVGYTYKEGRNSSSSFPHTEDLEIERTEG